MKTLYDKNSKALERCYAVACAYQRLACDFRQRV